MVEVFTLADKVTFTVVPVTKFPPAGEILTSGAIGATALSQTA
jgi:hypothetical protein